MSSLVSPDRPTNEDDTPLYAAQKHICPSAVSGPFRRIKWVLMVILLGIYYMLPFLRWDRGPYLPNQAVLVDFTEKKFYFFFIQLWPQEVYFFTGLLILASLILFLMNALAGRIWCGYLCPQTVWTDLYFAVERAFEGDAKEQARTRRQGHFKILNAITKVCKHIIWLLIALATGGAWVLYFADAPTLVEQLVLGEAPMAAYLWMGIFTATTYLLAGFAREQVCTYMCPWPRIQAALTDEHAFLVSYKYDRGEPRGSLKQNMTLAAKGEKAGDCIDCGQCVAACPTGVDIRHGFQLDCIQCGLCIDACDTVMDKIGKPIGLIGYDTDINIKRREQGLPTISKWLRPRTVLYASLIAVVGFIMVTALIVRPMLTLSAVHDRNPLFVPLSDGSIRNAYTLHLLNKKGDYRQIMLKVDGIEGKLEAVGLGEARDGKVAISLSPDSARQLRVLVTLPKEKIKAASQTIQFVIEDTLTSEKATANEHFVTSSNKRQ